MPLTPEKLKQMDLHECLQNELKFRKLKNPKYSLRSFARNLQIDPSLLLKFMNQSRPFTKGALEQIEKNFSSPEEALVKAVRELCHRPILVDKFEDIGNFHISVLQSAILQLFNIERYQANHELAAEVLNMTLSNLNREIDILLKEDLIYIAPNKQIRSRSMDFSLKKRPGLRAPEARIAYQTEQRERALKVLQNEEKREQSHFSSIAFAADPRFLAEVNKIMIKFRRNFAKKGEMTALKAKKHKVFALTVSVYSIEERF